MQSITEILAREGIPFEKDCPLATRSSFRIGGAAALGVFPKTREQMIRTLEILSHEKVRHDVVGLRFHL